MPAGDADPATRQTQRPRASPAPSCPSRSIASIARTTAARSRSRQREKNAIAGPRCNGAGTRVRPRPLPTNHAARRAHPENAPADETPPSPSPPSADTNPAGSCSTPAAHADNYPGAPPSAPSIPPFLILKRPRPSRPVHTATSSSTTSQHSLPAFRQRHRQAIPASPPPTTTTRRAPAASASVLARCAHVMPPASPASRSSASTRSSSRCGPQDC